MPVLALSGRHILVTRPQHQATPLIQRLQQQGATVYHQPAINIEAAANLSSSAILQALAQNDIAIFISKNAVDFTLKQIQAGNWPASLQIACIGQATARACESAGLAVTLLPAQGFDSEALLAMEAFSPKQIKAKKVVIFRGGEGREHLKDVLQSRQANVTYIDVYQRSPANLILKPAEFAILDTVLVSSAQGLENLLAILDQTSAAQLINKQLIVPSQRCYEIAKALGFHLIITADNASDEAMLASLLQTVTATI